MKAVLFDPYTRKVSNVEVDDYRDISKHLQCDLFCSGGYTEDGDAIYVNDEGLYEEDMFTYMPDVYPDPYAGRVLVLGIDRYTRESQDATIDAFGDTGLSTTFMTRDEVGRMYGIMHVN
jgi:hypothetical protein